MKALDLSQQKFGKLIALEKAPKRSDKHTRWICQCACGNIVEVRTDYLRSLHTTSCGCEKDLHFSSKIDTTKTYGKLSIDHYDDLRGVYICRCECGNIIPVKGYNLTNGNTQSCGCLKSKGELKINQILISLNIVFKTQYSFEDCRFPDTNKLAYFDYAIFNKNKLVGLIEYDGIQHECGWGQNADSLREIQARDKFKEYYCQLHNIPLIRVNYTEYNLLSNEYIKNLLGEWFHE